MPTPPDMTEVGDSSAPQWRCGGVFRTQYSMVRDVHYGNTHRCVLPENHGGFHSCRSCSITWKEILH